MSTARRVLRVFRVLIRTIPPCRHSRASVFSGEGTDADAGEAREQNGGNGGGAVRCEEVRCEEAMRVRCEGGL